MIFTLNTLSKLFALLSFILSTLCLFAGSQKSVLQNASVMVLNTSFSQPSPFLQSSGGQNITAADLGLKDFYNLHVLTYCEGTYHRDTNKNDSNNSPQVTHCSHRRAPFAFNPTQVFASEFKEGFNISDLNWPNSITDDFDAMAVTTRAMSVLYILGMTATGVSFLMEILLTQAGGKASIIAHLSFTVLSFVCLGVSSSVVSITANQFVGLINRHGQGYGVAAKAGRQFLGMTWCAVAFSFFNVTISVVTLPAITSSGNNNSIDGAPTAGKVPCQKGTRSAQSQQTNQPARIMTRYGEEQSGA